MEAGTAVASFSDIDATYQGMGGPQYFSASVASTWKTWQLCKQHAISWLRRGSMPHLHQGMAGGLTPGDGRGPHTCRTPSSMSLARVDENRWMGKPMTLK